MGQKSLAKSIVAKPEPKQNSLADWIEQALNENAPVMMGQIRSGRKRLENAGNVPGLRPDDHLFNAGVLQNVLGGLGQVIGAPITGALSPAMPYLADAGEFVGQAPSMEAIMPRNTWTGANGPATVGELTLRSADQASNASNALAEYSGYPKQYMDEALLGGASLAAGPLMRFGGGIGRAIDNGAVRNSGVPFVKGADSLLGGSATLKPWTKPQTRDLGVDFKRATDVYNSELPSLKFQYDEMGDDAKFIGSTFKAEDVFGDEIPASLREYVDENGMIGNYSGGHLGDTGIYYHPASPPDKDELMADALGEQYARRADDINDAHASIGTRWGVNPNALALVDIAKQLGYSTQNISRSNWNRYNEATRDLTPDEISMLQSNGLDPEDYPLALKLRASDHTRTSSQHEEPHINLSPDGGDFYDAAWNLANATLDKNGNVIFKRKPFPK